MPSFTRTLHASTLFFVASRSPVMGSPPARGRRPVSAWQPPSRPLFLLYLTCPSRSLSSRPSQRPVTHAAVGDRRAKCEGGSDHFLSSSSRPSFLPHPCEASQPSSWVSGLFGGWKFHELRRQEGEVGGTIHTPISCTNYMVLLVIACSCLWDS